MAKGKVIRIVRSRGFGFILPESSRAEVLFHSGAVNEAAFANLDEGDAVTFEVEPDPEQPNRSRAANVQVVSGKNES